MSVGTASKSLRRHARLDAENQRGISQDPHSDHQVTATSGLTDAGATELTQRAQTDGAELITCIVIDRLMHCAKAACQLFFHERSKQLNFDPSRGTLDDANSDKNGSSGHLVETTRGRE